MLEKIRPTMHTVSDATDFFMRHFVKVGGSQVAVQGKYISWKRWGQHWERLLKEQQHQDMNIFNREKIRKSSQKLHRRCLNKMSRRVLDHDCSSGHEWDIAPTIDAPAAARRQLWLLQCILGKLCIQARICQECFCFMFILYSNMIPPNFFSWISRWNMSYIRFKIILTCSVLHVNI